MLQNSLKSSTTTGSGLNLEAKCLLKRANNRFSSALWFQVYSTLFYIDSLEMS